MAVRRLVAAADVSTAEADAQVQPLAADAESVLTAVDCVGKLAEVHLVEVSAQFVAHVPPI